MTGRHPSPFLRHISTHHTTYHNHISQYDTMRRTRSSGSVGSDDYIRSGFRDRAARAFHRHWDQHVNAMRTELNPPFSREDCVTPGNFASPEPTYDEFWTPERERQFQIRWKASDPCSHTQALGHKDIGLRQLFATWIRRFGTDPISLLTRAEISLPISGEWGDVCSDPAMGDHLSYRQPSPFTVGPGPNVVHYHTTSVVLISTTTRIPEAHYVENVASDKPIFPNFNAVPELPWGVQRPLIAPLSDIAYNDKPRRPRWAEVAYAIAMPKF
ncbi:hypothetical protein EDB81DRAFT_913892 [Dactylonectria macrodidyma]|uniref:Uncharacterized protein n=1 Tax=Dactylonectria macrodidyma TaxID=307937 RepID=A0A9P9DM29_9HYPO|nr:hypothetical protein EDB81DRAFT_913892 [Dactylonectria macrodidyma]